MKNHLLLGNWNALCDSCGRKFKAFDLQKRWDGLMVCQEDFEQRHPQDLLKVQREKIAVPWSRPYAAEDTFIPENLWIKPEDNLGVTEQLANVVAKQVGQFKSLMALNGAALDVYALNGGMTVNPDPLEQFTFTETVLVTLARFLSDTTTVSESFAKNITKRLADSLPIGESLYFAEQEHSADTLSLTEVKAFVILKALLDTTTVTETTVYTLTTATALNGAALNKQTLG
jgi:hypothetical protein